MSEWQNLGDCLMRLNECWLYDCIAFFPTSSKICYVFTGKENVAKGDGEGEVHLAVNTGIRKAREESCYRDRTRHRQ